VKSEECCVLERAEIASFRFTQTLFELMLFYYTSSIFFAKKIQQKKYNTPPLLLSLILKVRFVTNFAKLD
jgi:hypothetical protein